MKFLNAGYKIFYYPEILMLHKSSTAARSTKGVYYELRNRYWFFRHFGTPSQQMRFLPPIIIHDFIYALSKKALGYFLKAILDGFGPLPMSLQPPLRSQNADFVSKVNERGRSLNLLSLVRRMKSKYLITNT